jgi:hypothetical protein
MIPSSFRPPPHHLHLAPNVLLARPYAPSLSLSMCVCVYQNYLSRCTEKEKYGAHDDDNI